MSRLAVAVAALLALAAAPQSRRAEIAELVSSALPGHAGAATDRQTRTLSLPAGRALSLSITIGDVRIQGESRDDAIVEVVRTAPTAEGLGRIPFVSEESAIAVRLSALQADDDKDPAYRTDVTLRVPRAASLSSIRVAEGRLTLQSFAGDIDANVRRGSVEATDVQGTLRLETEIGDIAVNRGRLTAAGLLRLRTFNGDVRLTLAERPSDARILALALNGTIESDIPLRTKDTWGPRFGEATLGTGEPVISIDVVTGRISLRTPR